MSETPDWLTAWQKGQDALLENQTKMAEAFQQAMMAGKAPHGDGDGGDGGDDDDGEGDKARQPDWATQQAAMMEQWSKMWQAATQAPATPEAPGPSAWMKFPWMQAAANPAAFAAAQNPFQAWQNPSAPTGMAAMAAMNPFLTGNVPLGGFPGAGASTPGIGFPGVGFPGVGFPGVGTPGSNFQGFGFPAATGAPQTSAWTDFLGNLAAGNPFVGTAMAGNPQDWMALMPNWASQPGAAEAFTAMKAMSIPAWWSADMPQSFKSWLDKVAAGPQFADMPNLQAQNAQAWRELLDYQQAVAHLSGIMSRAWEQAYHRFAESYLDQDWQAVDPNKALQDWIKIANTALLEAQRSPEFLDAQRDLMRAGLTLKQRQHKQAEDWCKQVNIPARSEVDDLIDVVHRLRQQLAELRNEINSLKGRKRS